MTNKATDLPGNSDTAKYFEMDGMPILVRSPNHVPEHIENNVWTPFFDTWKFLHEADPITKEEFNTLVDSVFGVK